MLKIKNKEKWLKWLLIGFVLLAGAELLLPGILYGHDLNFHIARIQGILDSLNSGNFPALILPGYLNNYGYANGVFYPDVFLYIPVLLCKAGLSMISSYELFLFLILIGLTASMYYASFKITKSKYASTMSSILYLMSSYRMTDMFLRSALGETLTFIFFPFFLLGIYKIFYENEKEWFYYTIGIVGISCSHVLSLYFCVLLTIGFTLLNCKKLWKEKNRLKSLFIGGILSILLSLWFVLPMLEMMLSDTFSFSSSENAMMVVERGSDIFYLLQEIPSGKTPWQAPGIGLIFLFLFIYFYKKRKKESEFQKHTLLLGLIFLFLSTKVFPWKYVKNILGIIQFPWRFYLLVTLLFVTGFSLFMKDLEEKKRVKFTIICLGFSLFTYSVLTYYHYRFGVVENFKSYSIVYGEYVPSDVSIENIESRGDVITSNHEIITNFTRNGIKLTIQYENNTEEGTYLTLPLVYYKGYYAKEGDKYLKVEKDNDGYVRVYLENNSGEIFVNYGFTTVRKVSMAISGTTLLGILGYSFYRRKNKGKPLA